VQFLELSPIDAGSSSETASACLLGLIHGVLPQQNVYNVVIYDHFEISRFLKKSSGTQVD
jgi:sulfite exporter TauE/SafE